MARARDEKGRYLPATGAGGANMPAATPERGRAPVKQGTTGGRGSAKAGAKPRRAKAALSRKEKLTIFFRELAMLCNGSEALRRSGLGGQSSMVYDLRRADAGFRARWEDAICESFAMLELEMLERSRFGEDRPAPKTDVEKRLRQVSTRQAMQLLKLYHDRVKARAAVAASAPPPARRIDRRRARELRIRVEKMLSDFNRRMGGEG